MATATFQVWDRAQRRVVGSIEIRRQEVERVEDVSSRIQPGTPTVNGPAKFARHSRIYLRDGSVHTVTVPAGEVHDRLRDADSEPPDLALIGDQAGSY